MIGIRLKILSVLPFFILLTTVFVVSRIDLERFILKAGERKLLHLSPEKAEMEITGAVPVTNEASFRYLNLFYPRETGKNNYSVREGFNLNDEVSKKRDGDDSEKKMRLTLVVMNGIDSAAIMDGHVVREGETVEGLTVKKIEKDRVLVKDKTLKWIYMEGKK